MGKGAVFLKRLAIAFLVLLASAGALAADKPKAKSHKKAVGSAAEQQHVGFAEPSSMHHPERDPAPVGDAQMVKTAHPTLDEDGGVGPMVYPPPLKEQKQ